MKYVVMINLIILMAFSSTAFSNECSWKRCPPVITYPEANAQFPRTTRTPLLHPWELALYVVVDSVAGFDWEIADSPPNAINYFASDPAGGTCGWHATVYVAMPTMSWTIACGHQDYHEPVYWRVRTVYKDGSKSNWAVAYYRVDTYGEHYLPPTITSPQISTYPKSTGLLHSWDPMPGAVYYDVAFANAPACTLDLFDECKYDHVRTIFGTSAIYQYEMAHTPRMGTVSVVITLAIVCA